MALNFDNPGAEGYTASGLSGFTLPLTIACWFNPDASNVNQEIIVLFQDSTKLVSLNITSSGNTAARTRLDGTSGLATSSTTFSAGAWSHACGVFAATNDRRVYLNGGGKGTNSTGVTSPTIGSLSIARVVDVASYGGSLAEIAVWNFALSDDEVASLAKGFSPLAVRPTNLKLYMPFVRTNQNLTQGLSFSTFGTVDVVDHPRIILPGPAV